MKKFKTMGDLMAATVPTTAETTAAQPKARATKQSDEVVQQQVVVQFPEVTVKALKVAALEANTSVRAVMLEALKKAGFPVPEGQTVDFRKVRRS